MTQLYRNLEIRTSHATEMVKESGTTENRNEQPRLAAPVRPVATAADWNRYAAIAWIVIPSLLLSCLSGLFWCLLFGLGVIAAPAGKLDSSSWSGITLVISFLVALRGNSNYERYLSSYRRLTSVCFTATHVAEYVTGQVLRTKFRDAKEGGPCIPIAVLEPLDARSAPPALGGTASLSDASLQAECWGRVTAAVSVRDRPCRMLLREIGILLSLVPVGSRCTFSSAPQSLWSYLQSRDPTLLTDELTAELASDRFSLEAVKNGLVRRTTAMLEYGMLQGTTGQVAFRTLNNMVDSMGQLAGARRTFLPMIHRDFYAVMLVTYVSLIPYIVYPNLGWYSIAFTGFIGAVLGGLLQIAAAVRDHTFVDEGEKMYIGTDSSAWTEDAKARILELFTMLDAELGQLLAVGRSDVQRS